MIVEWNTHIFSSDEAKYPFHPWAAYKPKPEMRIEDPLGDYLERMKTEGIDRAVVGDAVAHLGDIADAR